MAERLRVYLAGPITNCSNDQKHWWREEMKQRLGKQFDLEDPTDWADDIVLTREIPKLEQCYILVANMWKESIGTTLGVIRARQQGKPVVLIDPNRINNQTLVTLVSPEKPVYTIEAACTRVREIAQEFKFFAVVKSDGAQESFSIKKIAKSISQACSAAGIDDPLFQEHVLSPVIARVRHEGGAKGSIRTTEIRDHIFRRLETMRDDPQLAADVRARATEVVRRWEFKERARGAEESIRQAEEQAAEAQAELAHWKSVVSDMRKRETAPPIPQDVSAEAAAPRFTNATQVIDAIAKRWGAFLVFHDTSRAAAKKLKLRPAGLDDLYDLLDDLGEFMKARVYADAADEMAPTFAESFGDKYAPTESGATKVRFRTAPIAEYRGQKCFGLQHLKLKIDGVHVRVHFDEIGRGRLLICHVGGHLETMAGK